MHLYPIVKVIGQDFSKEKSVTVPQQSMTLREIIKRFVRGESLPISKEGTYEERMGDLEKLARADITVQMERVDWLKGRLDAAYKAAEASAGKGLPVESPSLGTPPKGDVTGGPVVGQAPPAAPVV